jgi:hypothetical protein
MTGSEERRRHARHARPEDHRIIAARVRPGYEVSVVNVSASGVLIESSCRLLPGTSVELQLKQEAPNEPNPDTRQSETVRGRVLRCMVCGLRSNSICYRGAIAFDRHLPWFSTDDNGYGVPSSKRRSARDFWGDATPQVV